ncbi:MULTISPECIES: hypothetical protein [unclassified Endozoicomonas]|uniref:hypothetical protein n=1 Tax=unclassified Endozoicomonas TaxID=2644528 RepID=UPI002148C153|nr:MULTISPECIES: hypothetical protein [unclassified Endozoicomonas]
MKERFVVAIQQNAGYPNQIISIGHGLHSLPVVLSDIADMHGFGGSDPPPDVKDHGGYGVIPPLIESISWQLRYATHLLVGYAPFLTTGDSPPDSSHYSWSSEEMVVALGWLLKSYWNPDLLSFNPIEQHIEQQEVNQDQSFPTITMVFGSNPGCDRQQYPPSESSSQQAPKATSYVTGYFTSLLYSDSDGGSGDPQQHSHTLGLNCFVHPCHGVCQFQPSGAFPGQSSCPHLTNGHCFSCMCYFDPENNEHVQNKSPCKTLNNFIPLDYDMPTDWNEPSTTNVFEVMKGSIELNRLLEETDMASTLNQPAITQAPVTHGDAVPGTTHREQDLSVHKSNDHSKQKNCCITIVCESGQSQTCGKVFVSAKSLWDHKKRAHSEQQACKATVVDKDGQLQPCGAVCKNARSLTVHKARYHTGQKTCEVTVTGKHNQQQPCGTVCKNAQMLSDHKKQAHVEQQTCDVTVSGADGQPRPCGSVCKNARCLSSHKTKYHTGQKTCNLTVIGKDGQLRLCGKLCENNQSLTNHKLREHGGRQTCGLTVVGKDGRPRACGTVSKNIQSLMAHKSKYHRGQRICEVAVIGEDGQQRPCGKVCKHSQHLSYHKIREHSRQKVCGPKMVGVDGQPRPCGTGCKNALALKQHKRSHRKRKSADVEQNQ